MYGGLKIKMVSPISVLVFASGYSTRNHFKVHVANIPEAVKYICSFSSFFSQPSVPAQRVAVWNSHY